MLGGTKIPLLGLILVAFGGTGVYAPCPVTPECTADGCVMAVHDECWVLNVLDMTTKNANAAKSACVAAYGDAAQLPEAATQADLDAIFALSQTYHANPVWMSATSNLCSILYNKNKKNIMVNRRCADRWTRSVVCSAPIVHDTSDSGADTRSVIKFEAYPAQLKSNLTRSASMRCSLADNAPNGGQIGKRQTLTSTPDDIQHILDIRVTRNYGTVVAYLSPFDKAVAVADLGNLQVKGNLTGPSAEGYLQLTWKDPSTMVMGEYVCQVNAVRASNRKTVVFTSTLEMTTVKPSIMDVIASFKKDVKECVSPNIGFTASFTRTGSFNVGNGVTVVYDRTVLNEGGAYNNITGDFHCQVAGLYNFYLTMMVPGGKQGCVLLKHNGNGITSMFVTATNSFQSGSTSATLKLKQGDVVNVYEQCNSNFYQDAGNVFNGNVFTGHLVKADKCLVFSN